MGEALGYLGYYVAPEAARLFIDDGLSKGQTIEEIRADELEFQLEILKMKVNLEDRIDPNRKSFLIRGIPDTAAYFRLHNFAALLGTCAIERRYGGVYLLDPLPLEYDYARTESSDQAMILHNLLWQEYTDLGYQVVQIPVMPILERAKFILSTIESFSL